MPTLKQLEQLKQLYVVEQLGQHAVATHMGVSHGSVSNWLKIAGIRRRSSSEVKKGKPLSRAAIEARVRSGRKYTLVGRPLIGCIKTADGYILLHQPDHPYATFHGYVAEHRLIVEKRLGRYLLPHEHVHHKNHKRDDNDDANLELLTKGAHTRKHNLERSASLSQYATMRPRGKNGRWR